MRPAPLVAGALVVAAAAMAAASFAGGGEESPPAPAARPAATAAPEGLAVWAAQGCGSCHTLAAANSHGTIGPDLEQNLRGMPAAYVKQAITDPDAVAAAGWGTGAMPGDYARRLSATELDALVRFLMDSAAE